MSIGLFRLLLYPSLILEIALFSFVSPVNAGTSWDRTYSGGRVDRGGPIYQAEDGSYVVFGRTSSFGVDARDFDASMMKIDPLGNIKWQKIYGDDTRNWATSFKPTSDGGYLIAGDDGYLVKVDSLGNMQWQKKYQTPGYVSNSVRTAKETPDGGIILLVDGGKLYGEKSSALVKLDHLGNIVWQKRYYGGTYSYDVLPLRTGGYVFMVNLSVNGEFPKLLILKLDGTGEMIWQNSYSGGMGAIFSSFENEEGNYLIFGKTSTSSGIPWAMQLNSDGTVLWNKLYDGLSGTQSEFFVSRKSDNGYLISLNRSGSYPYPRVMGLTKEGNIEFIITPPSFGDTYNENAIQTDDGGHLVCNYKYNQYTSSGILHITKLADEIYSCYGKSPFSNSSIVAGTVSTSPCNYLKTSNFEVVVSENNFNEIKVEFSSQQNCITALPEIKVDSSSVTFGFGNVEFATSVQSPVFVSNAGDSELTVDSVSVSGVNANDYSLVSNCKIVYPGGACTIDLRFSPTSLGNKEAVLSILSDDPKQPKIDIPLRGMGIDGTAPSIALKGLSVVTLEVGSLYVDAGATALDNYDGDLSSAIIMENPVNSFAVGTYLVSYNVSDSSGNRAREVIRTIHVVDTVAPSVSLTAAPNIIWPPQHKLVEVVVDGAATDAGSGIASVKIRVIDEYGQYNQPVSGFGNSVFLEATRKGKDEDGRHYTLEVVATDMSGNVSITTTEVIVPHDRGRNDEDNNSDHIDEDYHKDHNR